MYTYIYIYIYICTYTYIYIYIYIYMYIHILQYIVVYYVIVKYTYYSPEAICRELAPSRNFEAAHFPLMIIIMIMIRIIVVIITNNENNDSNDICVSCTSHLSPSVFWRREARSDAWRVHRSTEAVR